LNSTAPFQDGGPALAQYVVFVHILSATPAEIFLSAFSPAVSAEHEPSPESNTSKQAIAKNAIPAENQISYTAPNESLPALGNEPWRSVITHNPIDNLT